MAPFNLFTFGVCVLKQRIITGAKLLSEQIMAKSTKLCKVINLKVFYLSSATVSFWLLHITYGEALDFCFDASKEGKF